MNSTRQRFDNVFKQLEAARTVAPGVLIGTEALSVMSFHAQTVGYQSLMAVALKERQTEDGLYLVGSVTKGSSGNLRYTSWYYAPETVYPGILAESVGLPVAPKANKGEALQSLIATTEELLGTNRHKPGVGTSSQ